MSSFNDRFTRQARYIVIIATTIILMIALGTTSVSAGRLFSRNIRKAATAISTVLSSFSSESQADQIRTGITGNETTGTKVNSANKTRPITETFAPEKDNEPTHTTQLASEMTEATSVTASEPTKGEIPVTGTFELAYGDETESSSEAETGQTDPNTLPVIPDESQAGSESTTSASSNETEWPYNTSATTNETTQATTQATTQVTTQTTTQATTQATTAATTQATTAATTQATTAATTQATTTSTSNETTEDDDNLYVSVSGSNSNAGTKDAPFKTIQYAIDKAQPDSVIVVRAGIYNEKLKISGKSGLTIKNYPDERPELTGTGFTSGYLVDIAGSSGIIFTGFEIYNFKGVNLEGIMIRQASRDIEISYCKIHDIGTTQAKGNAHVILAAGDSNTALKNIVIRNNEIYNCQTGWSESVTMEGNVDGFKILNNKIHDVTNIAIDATGFYDSGCTIASQNQARNGLISGNLIYNVYCSYATAAGIYVDGGRDIIIERNTVHHSMTGIEIGCENAYDEVNPSVKAIVSNIIVRKNILYSNTEIGISIGGYDGSSTGKVINSQIYNNTLYKNRDEIILGTCDNIALTKNIFYGTGKASMLYNDPINSVTNLLMDQNVYFTENGSIWFELNGKSASSLSAWQKLTGQDLNSIFADPMFVNAVGLNFNLQTGSPATGIGAK